MSISPRSCPCRGGSSTYVVFVVGHGDVRSSIGRGMPGKMRRLGESGAGFLVRTLWRRARICDGGGGERGGGAGGVGGGRGGSVCRVSECDRGIMNVKGVHSFPTHARGPCPPLELCSTSVRHPNSTTTSALPDVFSFTCYWTPYNNTSFLLLNVDLHREEAAF